MINDRIRVLIGVAEEVLEFSDLPAGVLFVKAPSVKAGDVPGYFDELSVKLAPGHAAVLGRSYVRYMPPHTPVQEAIPTVEYVAPPARVHRGHWESDQLSVQNLPKLKCETCGADAYPTPTGWQCAAHSNHRCPL